jgi:glutamine synthetase
VNGSGKHNNWSLGTDKQLLFRPGPNPHLNLNFMLTLAATIRAVDLHGILKCFSRR